MTVVGSATTSTPESTTASTRPSSSSEISHADVIDASLPGRMSVDETIGSPSASSSACTMRCSGIRTPTVFFLGCSSRLGTSEVAGRMNV